MERENLQIRRAIHQEMLIREYWQGEVLILGWGIGIFLMGVFYMKNILKILTLSK